MKKRILVLSMVLALVMALVAPTAALAAETGTVSGYLVSVTVTDGGVTYGTLALNTTQTTLASGGGVNDMQTATNDGTVTENFNIKSTNAIRTDGTTWTLAATKGNNQFTHQFSINAGSSWTAMTTDYAPLKAGVAATTGTQTFDLQIGMPTATTDYLQHSITVTVLAVEH